MLPLSTNEHAELHLFSLWINFSIQVQCTFHRHSPFSWCGFMQDNLITKPQWVLFSYQAETNEIDCFNFLSVGVLPWNKIKCGKIWTGTLSSFITKKWFYIYILNDAPFLFQKQPPCRLQWDSTLRGSILLLPPPIVSAKVIWILQWAAKLKSFV